MRRAYQEAWPLQTSGGSGGHPGPITRLHAQGHYFIKDTGERFTVICSTNFNLQKIVCDGGDFVSFAGKFVEPKRPGG